MLCLVTQSCPTLCDPMDCSPPGSSVHGDSPGKNTGVGFHALLQGISPTQELNPCLSHCRQILYQLSYQRNPLIPYLPGMSIHNQIREGLDQSYLLMKETQEMQVQSLG